MEIGDTLREAREASNLSLDDIQEITKIQKRYLVAIEQNDFHALPGRFYARAFIKEYAQAVGLDATEVLYGFNEENIKTEKEESVQYTRLEKTKGPRSAKSSSVFSLLPSIIVIILVIGIIFVAWTLYQKTLTGGDGNVEEPQENDEIIRNIDGNEKVDQDETESSKENNETEDDNKKEEEEEKQAGSFSIVETGTGASPLSTLDFISNEEKIEVAFDVNEVTYVELKGESGEIFYSGTLDPESETEQFDVSAEERIYFNIGNAAGLTITINNVELEYPVDTNDRVHQKLWVDFIQD